MLSLYVLSFNWNVIHISIDLHIYFTQILIFQYFYRYWTFLNGKVYTCKVDDVDNAMLFKLCINLNTLLLIKVLTYNDVCLVFLKLLYANVLEYVCMYLDFIQFVL